VGGGPLKFQKALARADKQNSEWWRIK